MPEDSQWQKKRSKLHNLLFGSHGNLSPRLGTPEPTSEQEEQLDCGSNVVKQQPEVTVSMDEHSPEVESSKNARVTAVAMETETVAMEGATEDEAVREPSPVVKVENVEVCTWQRRHLMLHKQSCAQLFKASLA